MIGKIEKNKDVIIGTGIFLAGVAMGIIFGISLIWPLMFGLVCYGHLAWRRGFSFAQIGRMTMAGARESMVVVGTFLVIGAVSAAWRAGGTIALFVHYGITAISPQLFLLLVFLICCAFSYTLGSCFGTAGTIGIIMIAIAKAGDVSLLMTAGAVLSGGYFGDRCSPVSASASLTAFVTKTNLYDNIRMMVRTMGVPLGITTALYAVLSFANPLSSVDTKMDRLMVEGFNLSPVLLLPVLVMLILPAFKVNIKITALVSAALASIIAVAVQGVAPLEMIKTLAVGYTPADSGVGEILSGGGITSMLNICGIVLIACSYSKIITQTGLFTDLISGMGKACRKVGRTQMTFITGTLFSGMFCSCSAAIIMSNVLLEEAYEETGGSNSDLAIDIENTVELTATWVPWSAACMASFSAMAVSGGAIFFGFYVFVLPIYYMISKRMKERRSKNAFGNPAYV